MNQGAGNVSSKSDPIEKVLSQTELSPGISISEQKPSGLYEYL